MVGKKKAGVRGVTGEPRMYGQPLLNIQKGERMYKWFIFRPAWGRAAGYELRILTKEKVDGTLEFVSYNYLIVNGQPIKRDINREPNMRKEHLDAVVQTILEGIQATPEELEIVDLTGFPTVDAQIAYLKERDRATISYVA